VGAALLPDTGVDGAFDEDGVVVLGECADVSGEGGEGCVPGALPAGVRWGVADAREVGGGCRALGCGGLGG